MFIVSCVIVSWGRWDKVLETRWFITTASYRLSVLGPGVGDDGGGGVGGVPCSLWNM